MLFLLQTAEEKAADASCLGGGQAFPSFPFYFFQKTDFSSDL